MSWDVLAHMAVPFVHGAASPYGVQLAAVGLHPDNPDAMWTALQRFLSAPQRFKNADPCWPGKRDNLAAWDQGDTLVVEWPFGGGKWLTEAPHSDAQVRAVYRIPAGQATLPYLKRIHKATGSRTTKYRIDAGKGWSCPSGGLDLGKAVDSAVHAAQQGLGTVVDVANTLRIPGVNLTTALLTGKDLGTALHQDIANFSAAANVAKNVASGNFGAVASDLVGQAGKLGVSLPPEAVQAAVTAAATGASPEDIAKTALGSHYQDALNVATHFGTVGPGDVHPLTLAAKAVPLVHALAATPLAVPVHAPSVDTAVKASASGKGALLSDLSPWPSVHV